MKPIKRNSRRHPVKTSFENYPVVMDESMNIDREHTLNSIRRLLSHRVSDFSQYTINFSVTNPKFSTVCQWKK